MVDEKKEEIILDDANIVAYLSICNYKITPFKKSNGKIAFKIKGDISKAVREIYTNPQVPLLDYINALRSVRNQIFTLRSLPVGGAKC